MRSLLKRLLRSVISKINKSEKHCTVDLVLFEMGVNFRDVLNCGGKACKLESMTHGSGTCYCGKFVDGKLFTEEMAKARELEHPINFSDPPF